MKITVCAFRVFCFIAVIRAVAFAQDENASTPINDIWSAISFATMVVEAEATSGGVAIQSEHPEVRVNSVLLNDITLFKGGDAKPNFRCSSITLQGIPTSWLMRDALSTWADISTNYSRNRVPYGRAFLFAPRANATKGLFFIRKWKGESRIFFTVPAEEDGQRYKQAVQLVLATCAAESKHNHKSLLELINPLAPEWMVSEAVLAAVKSGAYRPSVAQGLIERLQILPKKLFFRLRSTAITVAVEGIENDKMEQVESALFIATLLHTPTPLSEIAASKLLTYIKRIQAKNGNQWNEARSSLRTAIMNELEVQNTKVKALLSDSLKLLKE